MTRLSLLERRMSRFLRQPPSVRNAAGVIVSATAAVVVVVGVLMRVLDHHEYPDIWVGMWWALQTVTTVGYGDVTPKHGSGRLVAAFVMLEGIAFLAIITAAITSTFVARAERESEAAQALRDTGDTARIEARLDALDRKLDAIGAAIHGPATPDGVACGPALSHTPASASHAKCARNVNWPSSDCAPVAKSTPTRPSATMAEGRARDRVSGMARTRS